MLLIDGKEYKITEEVVYVGTHTCNNVNGYNINFEIFLTQQS